MAIGKSEKSEAQKKIAKIAAHTNSHSLDSSGVHREEEEQPDTM